ncbi:unnamed protein product, partial [Brenthis ino]
MEVNNTEGSPLMRVRTRQSYKMLVSRLYGQCHIDSGLDMASTVVLLFTAYLLAVALCAPAQEQKELLNEKEDLQTAASHWGGYGYGGYGHFGHYYPFYGGYGYGWGYPGYGHYYGSYPYGFYGHHGYWW